MWNMLPWYVWLVLAALLAQLLRLLFFELRLVLYRRWATVDVFPPISVIIAARNEEDNLMAFLPDILQQDYPNYEVIVVDDASADGTEAVVRAWQKRYPHLRLRHIEDHDTFRGRKKYALTLGIKMAQHDLLVFTDADCRPASRGWLRAYASAFVGHRLVLGYGAYSPSDKFSFANFFIRSDTLLIALQYMSTAVAGMPYMGVGRNLGYHKDLFFKGKGFYTHMQLPSGDDDLFVNAAARHTGAAVLLQNEAITLSVPKQTWKEWSLQKMRHTGTFEYYSLASRLLLIFFKGAYLAVWAGGIGLLFTPYFIWGIGVLVSWLLLRWALSYRPAVALGEKRLWYALPLSEFVLMFIYLFLLRRRIIDLLNPWKNT